MHIASSEPIKDSWLNMTLSRCVVEREIPSCSGMNIIIAPFGYSFFVPSYVSIQVLKDMYLVGPLGIHVLQIF